MDHLKIQLSIGNTIICKLFVRSRDGYDTLNTLAICTVQKYNTSHVHSHVLLSITVYVCSEIIKCLLHDNF